MQKFIYTIAFVLILSFSAEAIVKKEFDIKLFVPRKGINVSIIDLPEPELGKVPYKSYAIGYHPDAVSFKWTVEDESIISVNKPGSKLIEITPLKEGTTYLHLEMYDAGGNIIETTHLSQKIVVGDPENPSTIKVAHIGSELVFYDGSPFPVVLPTQGDLELMNQTVDSIPDNRIGNDIRVNLYKGQLTIRNNIIPAIKGPGIDGTHLNVSYSYCSNANNSPIGWHNNLDSSLIVQGSSYSTSYYASLPDGRSYKFRTIPVPYDGDIIVPCGGSGDDVNYSKLVSEDGGFYLRLRNGTRYYYQNSQKNGPETIFFLDDYKLVKIQDRLGNAIQYRYSYDDESNPVVSEIREYRSSHYDPIYTGRKITLTYKKERVSLVPGGPVFDKLTTTIIDPAGRNTVIKKLEDNFGNGSISFTYPDKGQTVYQITEWRITSLTTPKADKIEFFYEEDPYAAPVEMPNKQNGKIYYLKSVKDASGTSSFTRHSNDEKGIDRLRYINFLTVLDMQGKKYNYEFTIRGQVKKRTIYKNQFEKFIEFFEWAKKRGEGHFLTKYTDINSVDFSFSYLNGNPIQFSIGNNDPLKTYYKYNDDFDIPTEKVDPMGRTWKNTLSNSNGLLLKTVNPDQTFISYKYNYNNQLTEKIDENGNSTKFSYNQYGLVKEISDAESNVTKFEYDLIGNLVKKTDANGNIIQYQYDLMNRMTKIIKPYGTIEMKYDLNGNLIERKDEEGRLTKYVYNHRNQLIEEEDPLGQKKFFSYNSVGQKISEKDKKGYETTYSYDVLNRVIEEKDPLDAITKFEYSGFCGNPLVSGGEALPTKITDKNENLITIEYDDKYRKTKETDQETNSTSFTYDRNSNLLEVKNGRNYVRKYKYNFVNLKFESEDPIGNKEFFEYDKAGNLVKTIDKNGHQTLTTFDKNNRPIVIKNHLGFETKISYDNVGNKTKVEDPRNHSTRYYYDSENRLEKIEDALVGTTTFDYDKVGNKISETDENGNSTQYIFDELNRLSDTIGAEGFVLEHLEYDANNNVILRRDAENRKTEYEFDKLNRTVKEINPFGYSKSYSYDNMNNLEETIDENGHKTTYTYNKAAKLKKIINHLGYYTENFYDAVYNVTRIRDLRGNFTTTEFDELNRPVKVTRPDNTFSETKYDSIGNVIQVTDFNGKTTKFEFDELNRKIKEIDPVNNEKNFVYDKNNNLIEEKDKRGNSFKFTFDPLNRKVEDIDPLNQKTVYGYFPNGNLKHVIDPNNLKVSQQYDKLNRKTKEIDHRGETTWYFYDKVNNLIRTVDRNGIVTENEFDDLNRLKKTIEDVGGINKITQYRYDNVGNRTQIIDSNNQTTTFEYDEVNRLKKHIFPDTNFYEFTYDQSANILTKRTPNADLIQMTYDSLNRMLTKNLGPSGTWTYSYDGNSNLLTAENPSASFAYTFDDLNRLTEEEASYTFAGQSKAMTYSYDPDSNLDIAATFSGKTLDYDFDSLSRLEKITTLSGETSFSYDNGSRLTSYSLPNGVTNTFAYDNLNRLLESKSSVLTIQQNFTKEANKLFERIAYGSVSNADHFAYDNLYRVIGTKYGVTSPLTQGIIGEDNQPNAPPFADVTGTKEQSSNLDSENNRISHTTNGATTNYEINSMNQYTQVNGTAFDWDNNGNLTSDGLRTFEYDWENRLLEVNNVSDNALIASYVYGPNGKCIGKILPDGETHSYFYDKDWNLVEEYVNNELAREFSYLGLDRPISSTVYLDKLNLDPALLPSPLAGEGQGEGVTLFYHQNSIGNVLALTDTTGNVLCRYQYDIDGKCTYLDKDGSVIPSEVEESYRKLNEFLFTARQIDLETGLYFFRNRMYSPELGRFTSVDSFEWYVDGINLYAYVNGNVVNLVDPMGTFSWKGLLKGIWHGAKTVITEPIYMGSDVVTTALIGAHNTLSNNKIYAEDVKFKSMLGTSQLENAKNEDLTYYEKVALGSMNTLEIEANILTVGGYGVAKNTVENVNAYRKGEISHEELDYNLSYGAGTQIGATGVVYGMSKFSGQSSKGKGDSSVKGTTTKDLVPYDPAYAKAQMQGSETALTHLLNEYGFVPKTTPVDLYAFGGKNAGPRLPRSGIDFDLDSAGNVITPKGNEIKGASTFADPQKAPLSGHYHKLPAGSELPRNVSVIADGIEVKGGTQPETHHTIYPSESMGEADFLSIFKNLGWKYSGKK